MPENILIAIAWPLCQRRKSTLGTSPVPIYPVTSWRAYHRLKGNKVLMVSGTDSHGTPVTIRADQEGKPVEEVYKRFHESFIEVFKGYGITYDLFTTTHTENHFKVSQDMFLALQKNGISCLRRNPCSGIRPRPTSFCPIVTLKEHVISAATKARAPINATTAATCLSRRD